MRWINWYVAVAAAWMLHRWFHPPVAVVAVSTRQRRPPAWVTTLAADRRFCTTVALTASTISVGLIANGQWWACLIAVAATPFVYRAIPTPAVERIQVPPPQVVVLPVWGDDYEG